VTGCALGCVKHHQSINHAGSRKKWMSIRLEPYVVASDVYSSPRMSDEADGHGLGLLLDVTG
jgi:hypothetical protein